MKRSLMFPTWPCKAIFNPVCTGGYPLCCFVLSTSAYGGYEDSPGRETCIPTAEVRIP